MTLETKLRASDAPHKLGVQWDRNTWPSFSRAEMACRHCGESYIWPEFMSRLQNARDMSGRPYIILSGHRCGLHNARVGGAPLSQHLKLAADIRLSGHEPRRLYQICKTMGFRGFGFYATFLHIDLGPKRVWYGNQKAKRLWQAY
ncbi:MAG: DUF882 domain-containing protein [Robiginitomaculum sp.]|nr:DUF882 domain-containing protein [Robiginitomaculum sp.]